jgi:nicotinate-nucleotide adenylyltransferase
LARVASTARALEHVVFVPAGTPPHKGGKRLAPVEKRVAALEILLADEPDVSIWTVEAERPGRSYTVDTLRLLRALAAPGAELFLLLGEDNLRTFATWRAAEEILALAEPLIAPRPAEPDTGSAAAALGAGLSAQARERLERGRLAAGVFPASSTELRERLARGEPPGDALPPRLLAYLRAERLYPQP